MPTPLRLGEGRAGREEADKHLFRSTGVVSTACLEGGLGNWGRSVAGGARNSDATVRVAARSGSRKGSYDRGSRVMPVEGRALLLVCFGTSKGEVIGDEPANTK